MKCLSMIEPRYALQAINYVLTMCNTRLHASCSFPLYSKSLRSSSLANQRVTAVRYIPTAP